MLDGDAASRAHVDAAITETIREFADEVIVRVHALGCSETPCVCGARELVIPARDARTIYWWMRKVKWRQTKAAHR